MLQHATRGAIPTYNLLAHLSSLLWCFRLRMYVSVRLVINSLSGFCVKLVLKKPYGYLHSKHFLLVKPIVTAFQ